MDQETEAIKQHIAETRESLSEKIDCLEQKVLKTVEGTTDMVSNTAESVAEAVTGTVQKVAGAVDHAVEYAKESLDLRKQVEARPWTMFGGSLAAGFIGGCMIHPSRTGFSAALDSEPRWERIEPRGPAPQEWEPFAGTQPRRTERPSPFAPALHRLRDLAITAMSKLVTDMVTSAVPPEYHEEARATISEFTSALRGQPQSESEASLEQSFASQNEAEGPREDKRPFNRMGSPRSEGGNGRH